MRRGKVVWILAVAFVTSPLARGDDAAIHDAILERLPAVYYFVHGDDAQPLLEIESRVFQLRPDSPARGPIERALLDALDQAATVEAKRFLCEQLRTIATHVAVPRLAALLTDPDTSAAAIRALGRLESPEASDALHQALATTDGATRAGIINALADRGYSAALADMTQLAEHQNAMIADAAIRALGRIGDGQTVEWLTERLQNRPPSAEMHHALLSCADRMVDSGKVSAAAEICQQLYVESPLRHFRLAGLKGLVQDCAIAPQPLIDAIRDTELQRDAIALVSVAQPDDDATTRRYSGMLPSLDPTAKVLMMSALAARGNVAAAADVTNHLSSSSPAVQLAAVQTLGRVGDGNAVEPLLKLASQQDHLGKVARSAIQRLKGNDIESRLTSAIDHPDNRLAVAAIQAVAARRDEGAVMSLFDAARRDRAAVRKAAIAGLGQITQEGDLSALLQLMIDGIAGEDRRELVESASRAIQRADSEVASRVLLDVSQTAPDHAQPDLIGLLPRVGTGEALARARLAMNSSDDHVASAAVQSLSEWPTPEATDDLVNVVMEDQNPAHRQLALSGFVRLAPQTNDAATRFAEMVRRLDHVNERKLVLAAFGQSDAKSSAALDTTLAFIDDPHLQATAGLAALRIANRHRAENEHRAREVLEFVIANVDHQDVRNRAQEVINDMEKYDGHIVQWMGVGPYTRKDLRSGKQVFETDFGPELTSSDPTWQPIKKGIHDWRIDLEQTFGGLDFVAAYLRTRVWSPDQRMAQLEMGADDGLRAWINGKQVCDAWRGGGTNPRVHRIPVQLNAGWNVLMLKVVDHRGGWGVCCRLRQVDGTAMDDLKYATD